MTGRRSSLRPCVLAIALAIGAHTGVASAQTAGPTPEELQAARELFQEAFKDEQEKRYAEALEKFRRVAKVKESPSVRYRIATVLAAVGRLRESRDMYRALAAEKASMAPKDQEIADSAAERAAELDKRIPRVSLRVQDNPPEDLRVTVDGAPVPASTTPRILELDPGDHVIAASGRGVAPSEQTVHLEDGGGEIQHVITLAEPTPPTLAEPTPPAPKRPATKNDTLAWVAIGGGGAFFVTGLALLAAREGAISEIEDNCPRNVCPTAKRSEVESAIDRAELFGPLGVTLGVFGLVAVGVGVYMLVRPTERVAGAILRPTARGLKLTF
jgi:hypothetical protein